MNKLTRKQVSTIFKTRTRMIKVKGNYKNGHTDLACRACKGPLESQHHALVECQALHPHGIPSKKTMDPFSKEINVLKDTAKNVERIIEEINNGSTGKRPVSSVTAPAGNQ